MGSPRQKDNTCGERGIWEASKNAGVDKSNVLLLRPKAEHREFHLFPAPSVGRDKGSHSSVQAGGSSCSGPGYHF